MATDKLFTVAGVSKLDGEYKVRFANDAMRVKVLAKHGHEDIRLETLPEAMTKYAAIQAIQGMDVFADTAAQSAIAEYLDENAPKVPKVKAAPKAKAAPKTKAVKDTKKSRESAALAEAAAVARAMKDEDLDTPFGAAEKAVGEAAL